MLVGALGAGALLAPALIARDRGSRRPPDRRPRARRCSRRSAGGSWPSVDAGAAVPEDRLAAVRQVPFLSTLPLPAVEGLATRLERVDAGRRRGALRARRRRRPVLHRHGRRGRDRPARGSEDRRGAVLRGRDRPAARHPEDGDGARRGRRAFSGRSSATTSSTAVLGHARSHGLPPRSPPPGSAPDGRVIAQPEAAWVDRPRPNPRAIAAARSPRASRFPTASRRRALRRHLRLHAVDRGARDRARLAAGVRGADRPPEPRLPRGHLRARPLRRRRHLLQRRRDHLLARRRRRLARDAPAPSRCRTAMAREGEITTPGGAVARSSRSRSRSRSGRRAGSSSATPRSS